MKLAVALAGLMLLQTGDFGPAAPAADPRYLRYERPIAMPPETSGGIACAVLDAAALAHSASRSEDDLRVFERSDEAAPRETQFVLTESEAEPGEADPATMVNLSLRSFGTANREIVFDLAMPHRAYTSVDLQIAAKDFVGAATVWGMRGPGGARTALGSFPVFDLSAQHLARSTSLPLQESSFPVLHIELRLRSLNGHQWAGLSTPMLRGADVPPSREAQTLYTDIAVTDAISQQGTWTEARLDAPAHLPVERVSFVLDPRFTRDFLREATVIAGPAPGAGSGAGATGIAVAEAVYGEIWRVTRPSGWAGEPAIHEAKLSVDAVLASNLRAPARITVTVKNGGNPALPLREVKLQMRRRMICFRAVAGDRYTLRYGDAALTAPSYALPGSPELSSSAGLANLFQSSVTPVVARLGPERVNPSYVARPDSRSYAQRHPDLIWTSLLISVALVGAIAIQSLNRQR